MADSAVNTLEEGRKDTWLQHQNNKQGIFIYLFISFFIQIEF